MTTNTVMNVTRVGVGIVAGMAGAWLVVSLHDCVPVPTQMVRTAAVAATRSDTNARPDVEGLALKLTHDDLGALFFVPTNARELRIEYLPREPWRICYGMRCLPLDEITSLIIRTGGPQ